jgi:hypothetical protein
VRAAELNEAVDACVWVDYVDALHAEFSRNGGRIVAAPQLRVHGMKELEVRDLAGDLIREG